MNTKDIERKLRESPVFDRSLIEDNPPPDLYEILNKHIDAQGLNRSDIFKRLNIERCYGYQILKGTRPPTRKHLIQMGIILGLSVDEVQELLKIAGKQTLYVRCVEDAKVYYCLEHKLSYEEAEEIIWSEEK